MPKRMTLTEARRKVEPIVIAWWGKQAWNEGTTVSLWPPKLIHEGRRLKGRSATFEIPQSPDVPRRRLIMSFYEKTAHAALAELVRVVEAAYGGKKHE